MTTLREPDEIEPRLSADPQRGLRWMVYGLLIAIACGVMAGRILRVASSSGATAMLSANDRSRWAAIRALVDHGTFELDEVVLRSDMPPRRNSGDPGLWPWRQGPPANRDREWYSIDMVRHLGADGREHYYSSKPPLLNLGYAAAYWAFRGVTGATLEERPLFVVRWLLVLTNVLPFGAYLAGVAWLVERHGRGDAGRIFVVAAAAFGTLLTPFASTLNNHLPAAFCALAALACLERIRHSAREAGGAWYSLAGLAGALTTVGELPALAFTAAVGVALAWNSPRRALVWAVPPALMVAAAWFGTNYWAHGSWRTPYAHRHDGPILVELSLAPERGDQSAAAASESARNLPTQLVDWLVKEELVRSTLPRIEWIPTDDPERFVVWVEESSFRAAARIADSKLVLRAWDNWYEYEGTYWTDEGRAGVDRGEESRSTYAFHVLFGHHGIFSITPIWVLAIVGCGAWVVRGDRWQRQLALGILALTAIVLAFYLSRPLIDRNYGGVSCGFRWMLWFVPLWTLALVPAADWAESSRWRWLLVATLLACSVATAASSAMNPWRHPWYFDVLSEWGWIEY